MSKAGEIMDPTPKLRFLQRKVPITNNPAYTHQETVLQQWWESATIPNAGEWRDVPVEDE